VKRVASATDEAFHQFIYGQNYFTNQTELEVMSYIETYQEAMHVEIL
jgi:hypothetical protein